MTKRVHSIFLHLMRSLSECPLWSTLRVRPSHRVFYPWGVRQIGGIPHIGMQCVHRCAWEECVLLPTMRVRQSAIRPLCIGDTGPAGRSKPTKCCTVQQHRNQALWKWVSTWAVKGWEGGFKKERKRGQTLKACPLLKGLKQKRPRGRRFNQD